MCVTVVVFNLKRIISAISCNCYIDRWMDESIDAY